MKKLIILLFISINLCADAQVGGLTQSADGKSTIPLNGSALSLDLQKTSLSFTLNNISQVRSFKKSIFSWGFDVTVKGEEGLGNLFSTGDLVPSGQANLFIGLTFSNYAKLASSPIARRKNALVHRNFNWANRAETSFVRRFKEEVDRLVPTVAAGDQPTLTALKSQLGTSLQKMNFYSTITVPATAGALHNAMKELKEFAEQANKDFNEENQQQLKGIANVKNYYDRQGLAQRFSILPFGGINAMSFKHFLKYDSVNLNKSSETVSDRGGKLGLILNYQAGDNWFGLSYAYSATNNFENLQKFDYTVRKTINLPPNQLIEEKTFSSYKGNYGKVECNELNLDYIHHFFLTKDKNNHLLVNPYLRSVLYSRDTSLLSNKINLGVGFYFFGKASKFIGGFYIECPDVNNNAEKKKPVDQQNLLSPWKRMSFGVVAKFSFSSLIGF